MHHVDSRVSNRKRSPRRKAFLVLLVVLVYVSAGLFSSVFQAVRAIKCGSQLEAIGSHIGSYQADHEGKNSPDLQTLLTNYPSLPSEVLICPNDHTAQVGRSSYVYRGNDLTETSPPEMILTYEKNPNHPWYGHGIFNEVRTVILFGYGAPGVRLVLFANGLLVRSLTEDEFLKAIDRDNELRKQLNLPQKFVK